MLIQILMAAGVVVLALPALVLGLRRLTRRGQRTLRPGGNRSEFAVVLLGRVLGLLLILLLSALVLVATIGALVQDLELPSLVYVFFVLDLLLAALVVLTSGGPRRRRGPRRGNPARR